MTSEVSSTQPVAPERLAEAGVWIARMHGDHRSAEVEEGLRRWLKADRENARAFERATEAWDESVNLRRIVPFTPIPRTRPKQNSSWGGLMLVATMGMALIVAGVMWHLHQGVITTGIGEQRQMVLKDGTRVFLNTDTRLVVKYDEDARRVELQRGEALFNVAKRPDWPFIVVAGKQQVRALGTSFVVRRDDERLAVTLVEGKVVVSPAEGEVAAALPPSPSPAPVPSPAETSAKTQLHGDVFTMRPGQRITFNGGSTASLEMPSIDKAMAWRRGQVILDDTPLRIAVSEMNRYNATKLVIEDTATAELLINGLFQAGDSTHFANAVAEYYGLRVIERDDEIVLAGTPVH